MPVWFPYVLFCVGFVLLIKGADWLVEGASSIAKKYRISDFVIGLTIVSLGTSMPELIVNIIASVNKSAEMALGNIIGSNISNILLILGVSAMIFPLTIGRGIVRAEIPISILAVITLFLLGNFALFGGLDSLLTRGDGIVLLVLFGLFVLFVIRSVKKGKANVLEQEEIELMSQAKSLLFVTLGCLGLFLGGQWVVNGAKLAAIQLGMTEKLVGLTVVAIGTSLPELVTSAVAASKKNTDIAVANVVGSNIFNILWVLGLSAVINPLGFDDVFNTDLFILTLSSVAIILFGITRGKIDRFEGILFLLSYIAYTVYLIYRG